VRFDGIRVYPKPVGRRVPVVLGGNSDAALRRVAAYGDGWYGFNVGAGSVAERIELLAEHCRRHDRSQGELTIAVALADPDPAHLPALARAGVTEYVVVASPPDDPHDVPGWVAELAARWECEGPAAGC
jgi:alkanesulfonate monooxygenase SsuD/methylene tetrahydromethanopterin reductase-like flavin-dependent oxidoreductase (luciferase family)